MMSALSSRRLRLVISASMVALLGLFVSSVRAEQGQPLKVAIVGLEHGHVEGFLGQLPKHSDV